MKTDLLTVARDEMIGEVARRMVERWVGSAIVSPHPPGIITERDVLELVGAAQDPRTAHVADHFTPDATCAGTDWSLEHAAEAMIAGRFRHLIVVDGDQTIGIISIRDIVRSWIKGRGRRPVDIQIREAMNPDPCTVGRDETLRQAARRMVDHGMGAAIVESSRPKPPPGIITERDVLATVGAGQDPQAERVAEHLSRSMTFSAPDWSLRQAAEAMTKGGFQHVVVVDATGIVGIISMSDIVRRWLD
ncbi:MAG: CBS domain-containing protein [Egibacteraceae bacterium]